MAPHRIVGYVLVASALLAFSPPAPARDGKPLTEAALSALVDQQIPDDIVVKRIETSGVAFDVDAATLERLQKAGASKAVLAAVQQAGQPANAVTYEGVLKMLRQGANEPYILQKLQASPTTLVLDDEQIAALRKAGATDKVLDALQRNRNPVGVGSDISDFAVVLDCSGSMKDLTPDGVSKMESAKKVVTKFIRDLPNGKHLAFIVYGTEPQKYKCQDVHVVQPLAPLTDDVKDELTKYIDGLEAAGYTPLALGMQTAGKELAKSKGLCQLVVVTDGMESCHGSPGDVAEDLAKNLNLPGGVDIIGFGVDPDEKAALNALAKKGKVNLYEAAKADDLTKKIKEAQERAERDAKARADELAKQREKDDAAQKERDRLAKIEADRLRKEKEDKERENAASKDDFPGSETIKWDVSKLEDDTDDYTIVKRVFDKDANAVKWVVKSKSERGRKQFDEAYYVNNKLGMWAARFLNEDGVELKRVQLRQQPPERTGVYANLVGIKLGDPVSLTLPLDDNVMKKTKTVVVELLPR